LRRTSYVMSTTPRVDGSGVGPGLPVFPDGHAADISGTAESDPFETWDAAYETHFSDARNRLDFA